MTANLQPLREKAKKWHAWKESVLTAFPDEEHRMEVLQAIAVGNCADEIDAFCDAAEAWLQDKRYYSREGIKKELVRTALIGEKKP